MFINITEWTVIAITINSIILQKSTKKNENLNGFPTYYGALSFGCFKLKI